MSSQIKKSEPSSTGVLAMDQKTMKVISPDEFKIGDAPDENQDLHFDSDSELENMLTDDAYLSKKMKHQAKNQIRDAEILLQTPEKKSACSDDQDVENKDANQNYDEDYDPRNPKIQEFKIYDQVAVDPYKDDNFEDEEDGAKYKNKGKLRQLANQKKGIVEHPTSRPPLITPKSTQEFDLVRRSTMNRNSRKATLSESQFVRDVNKSLRTSEQNFKEFKLNDSPSKMDDYEFSEVSSIKMGSPTSKEKEILGNFSKSHKPKVDKEKALKIMNKNLEIMKIKEDNEGPKEFRLGDSIQADFTEGFESYDGEGDEEKQMRKQAHKEMKQAYLDRVNEYKASKVPISRKTTFEVNASKINPREFVL